MILSSVVSKIESSDSPFAMRYEDELFQHTPSWINATLLKITAANPIDKNATTARMIAVTSWGQFQILGANIYDRGYAKNIIQYCSSAADQLEIFSRFIATEGFDANEDTAQWSIDRFVSFAAFYNGPGQPGLYVAAMRAAAAT